MSTLRYEPRGAMRDLFTRRDRAVVLSGPAGTGKSLGCLHKMHLCALKYDRMRALMVRKTRESLTQSGMVTFENKVRPELNGVTFHHQDQEYRYPRGSVIVVGGLDKPSKVMSAEYDLIYMQEATEFLEGDLEALTTRLRNGVMPYQQLIGDCNPGPPTHWLRQRSQRGALAMLETRHEDNPMLWDGAAWTPAGIEYIAKLDELTGVRKLRLRGGIWAAAEGMVYEGFDPAVHVIPRIAIPHSWPRYWSVDFGYTNPYVCQWWAQDPDGRLYRYRELYRTQRLVEDHAAQMLAVSEGEPRPRAIVCDHDAEDRATLERHLKMETAPAYKAVSPGIQAVAARLRPAGDGKPRLLLLADSLIDRDPGLADRHLPCCSDEEAEGYIWDTSNGRKQGEEPLKKNDHGMDCARYLVAHVDQLAEGPSRPHHAAAGGERAAIHMPTIRTARPTRPGGMIAPPTRI